MFCHRKKIYMGYTQTPNDMEAPEFWKALDGLLKNGSIQMGACVYCQMLQRGLERFRPFGQGVHHSGACIFERDAVELSELTNNLRLFLSEASLDAKSVETWL